MGLRDINVIRRYSLPKREPPAMQVVEIESTYAQKKPPDEESKQVRQPFANYHKERLSKWTK